jgi:uncharacterized Ntn-hydrolase superfamily protein
MTFSIVGFDPINGDLGIAVHSKFPNVRVTIPFAQAGVGAIATQSYCNTSFGPKGLELLKNGASPQQVIDILVQNDKDRDFRQVGVIDSQGNAANYTGLECFDWAGGYVGENCSVQGNVLAGEKVITSMEQGFQGYQGSLAERLIHALNMGQESGGDRRGQQSAALLVVRENGGYGGYDDHYVDISVYDHPQPIAELKRLYELHRLTYFKSEAKNLKSIDSTIAKELQGIMQIKGFYKGEINGVFDQQTQKSLHDFMGWENYDERMRDDDLIDLEVLNDIRKKHQSD